MTYYYINFTQAGKKVRTWGQYLTYAEAQRAIMAIDHIIPLNWSYTMARAYWMVNLSSLLRHIPTETPRQARSYKLISCARI